MSVTLTLGAEFAVAKAVDYSVATVARQKGSPSEAFFASMAREGLRVGWDRTGEMLPWWYGALSSGATGATDFVAGSVLAGLLRSQFDAVLAAHPDLKESVGTPKFEDVTAALRGEALPGLSDDSAAALKLVVEAMVHGDGDAALLKRLIEGAPGVTLQSPISRHLQRAITDPTATPFAGFVKRNLLSKEHADENAIGGTVAGYALKGALTGAAFGHADVGAAVTLLDSLTEGVLAQKAMKGDYRALTAVKAQLLQQGVQEASTPPGWKGHVSNRFVGVMNQMGEEVRLFGQDLGHLAAAGDVVLDRGLLSLGADVGGKVGAAAARVAVGGHAAPPPPTTVSSRARGFANPAAVDDETASASVRSVAQAVVGDVGAMQGRAAAGSVAHTLRAQVRAARDELHHHADVRVRDVLAADFAREREAIAAFAGRVHARTQEQMVRFQAEYPNLSAVLSGTADRTTPDSLQRLCQSARAVADHAVHLGAAGAAVAVDAVARAGAAVVDSDVGQAVLHLAERVWLSFQVELTMGAEAVRDIAQQAAFGAIAMGGGAVVAGLLAGERFARAHEPQLKAHLERANAASSRVLGATHAALQVVGQSASRGAVELGRLLGRVLHAVDDAVGRVLAR
jgi:gas vesicle protein